MALSVDITNPQDLEQGLLSVDVVPEAPRLDKLTAERRAANAMYGLPFLDKGIEEYTQTIAEGAEGDLRKQSAYKVDQQRAILVQEAIANVAKRNPDRPITTQEVDMIKRMAQDNKISDPADVFEVAYGKQYMNYLDKSHGGTDSFWQRAKQENPELTSAYSIAGSESIAKFQYLRTMAEDEEAHAKQQGWGPYLVDLAKGAAPGYTGYKMRGNVPGVGTFEGGFQGTNYIEQARGLAKMPLEEIKKIYPKILEDLRKDNPSYAAEFARRMMATSRDDEVLNNAFDVLDAIGIGGLAKAAVGSFARAVSKSATKAASKEIRQSAETMVKSAVKSDEAPSISAPAAAGDLEQAALSKVIQRLDRTAKGSIETPQEAIETLPSIMRNDAKEVGNNPGRSGEELAQRIERQTWGLSEDMMDAIVNTTKVQRMPFMNTPEALQVLKQNAKTLFPGVDNNIINIQKSIYNPITGTYDVDLILGAPGAVYWRNFEQAKTWAKNNNIPNPIIEKWGNGFYVKLRQGLSETDNVMRDMQVKLTPDLSQDPVSFLGSFTGWIRNPDEVLSVDHRLNRKTAAYGPNALLEVGKERAQYIRELQKGTIKTDPVSGLPMERMMNPLTIKNRFREWERVLKLARTMPDPADGKPGYFFKTIPEYETFYQQVNKRLPDEVEIQAYFSYKDLVEMDRVFRNVAVYKNKKRVNSETFTPEVLKSGMSNETMELPKFDGVLRDNIPGGEATILVLGRRAGEEKVYDTKQMPIRQRKIYEELKAKIQKGEKQIVELYSPEERPFEQLPIVGGKRIRYVIADAFKREDISWDQVPRRGGGHWEVDYDWYVKQAKIRPERINGIYRDWYEGDITIMPAQVRALGKDVAQKLDDIRVLLKNDNVEGARSVAKKYMDIEWDEIYSWFKPSKDEAGKITAHPRLSLDEPIQVVQRDKMIGDVDTSLKERYYYTNTKTGKRESTFKDGTKEGSLARQYQVQFTGERDAHEIYTVKNVGTRHEPLYQYEPAKFVDPVPVMNRALSKIAHSTFLEDYKMYSIESWLAQAEKYLKASPEELRTAPLYHFHKVEYLPSVDADTLSRLKSTHWQIRQLLGEKSTTDQVIDSVLQRVADSIYGRFGSKGLEFVPTEMLYSLRDPFKFMRQVAFTTKLGLYAVPQILVQSATYSNIWAIAGPKHAAPGSAAAAMTWYARINKNVEILNHIDNLMTKLNIPGTSKWRAGEWKESMALMDRAGFDIVAGEQALKDNSMNVKVIRSSVGEFLDGGEVFFKTGERNTRFGAWHTAYREFRDAHPDGRITPRDAQFILERADMLSGNMSKASSSWLHTGMMSLPMQFLTYQLRMGELVFGKRLTMPERVRLAATQSLLYGIPVGTLGLTGIPFADIFRKHAIENGYVVGDNVLESTLTEGVPALIGAMVTSTDGWDPSKGTWFNFGDRFGSKGFDALKEPFKADPDYLKIVGGAGVGTISSIISSSSGLLTWLKLYREQDPTLKYPFTMDDVLDVFKEISSVNNFWRGIAAAYSGKWMSKKEMYLMDTTTKQAFFMALTGTQPQQVADMQSISWSLKDEHAMQKKAGNIFIRDFRRGLDSDADNPEQAAKYFARAFAVLDVYIPEDKKDGLIQRASENYESMVDRLNFEFYINKGRQDPTRLDAFQRIQRMREGK